MISIVLLCERVFIGALSMDVALGDCNCNVTVDRAGMSGCEEENKFVCQLSQSHPVTRGKK